MATTRVKALQAEEANKPRFSQLLSKFEDTKKSKTLLPSAKLDVETDNKEKKRLSKANTLPGLGDEAKSKSTPPLKLKFWGTSKPKKSEKQIEVAKSAKINITDPEKMTEPSGDKGNQQEDSPLNEANLAKARCQSRELEVKAITLTSPKCESEAASDTEYAQIDDLFPTYEDTTTEQYVGHNYETMNMSKKTKRRNVVCRCPRLCVIITPMVLLAVLMIAGGLIWHFGYQNGRKSK